MTNQPTSSTPNRVAILDAGAQYAKVIDRRIRELGIETEVLSLDTPATDLTGYGAIIISGGPESVYADTAPEYDPALFELQQPILGICYGMQLMVHTLGGRVERKARREDGQAEIEVDTDCALFAQWQANERVLLTHGDTVDAAPDGFEAVAHSGELIAAVADESRGYYGVQFHPEVDLTEHGQELFETFLFEIAELEATFTLEDRRQKAVAEIREQVGDQDVLVLLSGGVDSSVTAALLREAVPVEQIYALHIDTGLMRKDESASVMQAFQAQGLEVKLVEAAETFLDATTEIDGVAVGPLREAIDPEYKRKIIGDTFVRVAEDAVAEWDLSFNDVLLAQGSLRPDLIESASTAVTQHADTIKTHHNDTQLIRGLRDAGRVVEPLKEYHKDEVRQLGLELGLPEEIVWRQPFPGPGLGIRVLCAAQPYRHEKYQEILEQLRTFETASIKPYLLPVRTVGIQGDGRTYSHAVALTVTDPAGPDELPSADQWQDLMAIALEIPQHIHQINRVVYLHGAAPDSQQVAETFTSTTLTPPVLEQLRVADAAFNRKMFELELQRTLTQVPIVSIPLGFEQGIGGHSIVIRTFITNDFMTGVPAVPGQDISLSDTVQMTNAVATADPAIARVMYDLTSKPPGTTEWE